MSLLAGETAQFEFPQKPHHQDPFAIAEDIIRWTQDTVPYAPNSYYRPEFALSRGGVNCYGVAQAAAELAEFWDIPAGIVLDENHAHTLIKYGGAILFLEAGKHGEVRTVYQEADKRDAMQFRRLGAQYEQHLGEVLEHGYQSAYFFGPDMDNLDAPWQSRRAAGIYTGHDLSDVGSAHIVVDATQGREMLCAIGDLRRYKALDKIDCTDHYREMLPELIGYVPDFLAPRFLDTRE